MKRYKIFIDEKGVRTRGLKNLLKTIARRLLKELAIEHPCELSILLTDDCTIRELNLAHRNIDSPTDVLAFPMREGFEMTAPPGSAAPEVLGDIVISLDRTNRQAKDQGHSLEYELAFLFTHGLLHILGYNDEEPQELLDMKKKGDELLLAIDLECLLTEKGA
jgi:probable rRNA maturation factor